MINKLISSLSRAKPQIQYNLKKGSEMLPIIPIVSVFLPALIQSAEQIFSGEKKGPEKKAFVVNAVSSMVDKMIDKTPLPKYVDKNLMVDLVTVLVEHYVPAVLK